ncbi:MAG: hypothetical protein HY870_20085 [Chloroflexi bacterium]|nr:hypothetical protein [Chloroflexota bacterium]
MNLDNPVIKLCLAGTQAEFEHRLDDARRLYRQAWNAATDDYEACIAAHYVARHQTTPHDTLRWNQIALDRAEAADADRVGEFYPSLYLNLGRSHEVLGQHAEAQRYYDLAADLGLVHQTD